MGLILQRGADSQIADQIEEMLEELVLAVTVLSASKNQSDTVLESNGKSYRGLKEIADHVAELSEIKKEWDRFQSDSCYCDEDGEVI